MKTELPPNKYAIRYTDITGGFITLIKGLPKDAVKTDDQVKAVVASAAMSILKGQQLPPNISAWPIDPVPGEDQLEVYFQAEGGQLTRLREVPLCNILPVG